jgi:hypothetical protein
MRLEPGEVDVTAHIYADRRDERIDAQVQQCWAEQQLSGWRSVQSAQHRVRYAKCGRRKVR